MTTQTAFIGDVHGSLRPLLGILGELNSRYVSRAVFLGDYINKGLESAQVIEHSITASDSGAVTLLCGNHESAFLDALETNNLAPFLKMGGAATIRSYVGGDVGPDVAADLKAHVPLKHIELLRRMPILFQDDDVVASHKPLSDQDSRYHVYAHIPVGPAPVIRADSADIDTGCGAEGGRLTALLWPSLTYIQVDGAGERV
jgi:calcineurin-like phosphoesterase family protein